MVVAMKNNKRDLILDTAEKLMMIVSDNDITVNLIAENAGIGKGSVYYYFESKDEIIDAVVERSYRKGVHEYFSCISEEETALKKIELLFKSIIKKEFRDRRENLILALHLHDDPILHHKMQVFAIREISPILSEILVQGNSEGTMHTETPEESAEMIVATLSFLLDGSVFPTDNNSMGIKMKIYAQVLETCLRTEKGRFDFLFSPESYI